MKKNKGVKYILSLIIKYLPMLIIIVFMSAFDSATYTYVSMFIKYIIAVLEKDFAASNSLPNWLIAFFNSGSNYFRVCLSSKYGIICFSIFARCI